MAYSDEQRPEAQFGNQSRNSLNIQQPGETDSYDVFFSDPNRWKDNSTSFSLGDVLPTMGKGVAQSVRGTGEMARGLGDAMIQSPVKTGVRILNEFSRMGLPGYPEETEGFAQTARCHLCRQFSQSGAAGGDGEIGRAGYEGCRGSV